MTCTLILQVVDELGHGQWPGSYNRSAHSEASPAATFGDWQPGDIPLSIRHLADGGVQIGWCEYLECGIEGGDLVAVATTEAFTADTINNGPPIYCSAEIRSTFERGSSVALDSELNGLAIVACTASVAAARVRAFGGDYRDASCRGNNRLLARAAEATKHRRWQSSRPHRLQVHRPVDEYAIAEAYERTGRRPPNLAPMHYTKPFPGILAVH